MAINVNEYLMTDKHKEIVGYMLSTGFTIAEIRDYVVLLEQTAS